MGLLTKNHLCSLQNYCCSRYKPVFEVFQNPHFKSSGSVISTLTKQFHLIDCKVFVWKDEGRNKNEN